MSSGKIKVMVDIETLDTERTAVILSIGACTIESFTTTLTFYEEIDYNDQVTRTRSDATVEWWKSQEYFPDKGIRNLRAVLTSFSAFLGNLEAEPIIWCKGTDFDTAILAHAYKCFDMEVPWKYNAVRDFRTVKKMFPVYIASNPTPHNALADALHQAAELIAIQRAYDVALEV